MSGVAATCSSNCHLQQLEQVYISWQQIANGLQQQQEGDEKEEEKESSTRAAVVVQQNPNKQSKRRGPGLAHCTASQSMNGVGHLS